jgi:hypothetical protein
MKKHSMQITLATTAARRLGGTTPGRAVTIPSTISVASVSVSLAGGHSVFSKPAGSPVHDAAPCRDNRDSETRFERILRMTSLGKL